VTPPCAAALSLLLCTHADSRQPPRTLATEDGSAPRLCSSSMQRACPSDAARCKGVKPPCKAFQRPRCADCARVHASFPLHGGQWPRQGDAAAAAWRCPRALRPGAYRSSRPAAIASLTADVARPASTHLSHAVHVRTQRKKQLDGGCAARGGGRGKRRQAVLREGRGGAKPRTLGRGEARRGAHRGRAVDAGAQLVQQLNGSRVAAASGPEERRDSVLRAAAPCGRV
jgi:hypothetical protein